MIIFFCMTFWIYECVNINLSIGLFEVKYWGISYLVPWDIPKCFWKLAPQSHSQQTKSSDSPGKEFSSGGKKGGNHLITGRELAVISKTIPKSISNKPLHGNDSKILPNSQHWTMENPQPQRRGGLLPWWRPTCWGRLVLSRVSRLVLRWSPVIECGFSKLTSNGSPLKLGCRVCCFFALPAQGRDSHLSNFQTGKV